MIAGAIALLLPSPVRAKFLRHAARRVALLELKNINRRFGDPSAVHGVSLAVEDGEFLPSRK